MFHDGPDAEAKFNRAVKLTNGITPAETDFSGLPEDARHRLVLEELGAGLAELQEFGMNAETSAALLDMAARQDPAALDQVYARLRFVPGTGPATYHTDPKTGQQIAVRPRVPSVSAHKWAPDTPMPSETEDGPGSRTATLRTMVERAERRARIRWDLGPQSVAVFASATLLGVSAHALRGTPEPEFSPVAR
jgi:hypothetical protein